MIKWYKNLKIINKLISAFLVVAIMGTIIGLFGIFFVMQIKNSDAELYETDTLGLEYTGAAAVNLQQLRYNILKLLTVSTDAEMKDTLALVEEYNTSTNQMIERIKSITLSKNGKKTFEAINDSWAQYQKHLPEAVSYMKSSNTAAAREIMLGTLAPIGVTMRDDFLELMDELSSQAKLTAANNSRGALTAAVILIVIVVASIVVSVFFALFNAKIIGKPIVDAVHVADLLSVGNVDLNDLSANPEYNERKDEIGLLSNAFMRLIKSTLQQVAAMKLLSEGDLTLNIEIRSEKDLLGKSLAEVVKNFNHLATTIINSAERVSSDSSMVSNSSLALSQGATEQASSVEELTASLEEISSQTNLNAQNAERASESAKNAKTDADKGNELMHHMLKAMDDINASSNNINKIIKVIDDIAFQTNILALNAAVEAARAGQHGKGFAVVAEEVRTLAARSANAVKETADMITGSIKSVDAGAKLAKETAAALDSIVAEVAKAADLVSGIAIASREQALGIEQINLGINQVSQVVQTNAATSEESAAASEDLSAQAARLKEALRVFKISKAANQEIVAEPVKKVQRTPREELKFESTPKKEPQAEIAFEEEVKLENAPPVRIKAAPAQKPVIVLSDAEFGKY